MIKKRLYFLLIFLFLAGCGFKVIGKKNIDFGFTNINTTGNTKINYLIKNNLSIYNSDKNIIELNIETDLQKNIKEKNFKNKDTKYELTIKSIVNYQILNKNSKGNFSITKNGVYDVKTQYSDTLIYERNLISSLTDEIADEIVDNILVKFNDL